MILHGLLTDQAGPLSAADVYPGNTGDPTTVSDQVEKLRRRFSLTRVVIVGDRGMLTQAQIEKLKEHPGLGRIASLRSHTIRALVETGQLDRRCLKGVDVLVRPAFHRTEDDVRAHVFLCMLAHYLEWHLHAAWAASVSR